MEVIPKDVAQQQDVPFRQRLQPTIELDLPYPPSVNHYWRNVGSRTLISRQGRKYRETVVRLVCQAGLNGMTPLQGALCMETRLYPPDRRRRDLDNTLKAVFDALESANVYGDDSQVKKLTVEMCQTVCGGRATVSIGPFQWKGST